MFDIDEKEKETNNPNDPLTTPKNRDINKDINQVEKEITDLKVKNEDLYKKSEDIWNNLVTPTDYTDNVTFKNNETNQSTPIQKNDYQDNKEIAKQEKIAKKEAKIVEKAMKSEVKEQNSSVLSEEKEIESIRNNRNANLQGISEEDLLVKTSNWRKYLDTITVGSLNAWYWTSKKTKNLFKFNNDDKKTKLSFNSDVDNGAIITRNWKKIWIWSGVGVVVSVAIVISVYFSVVLTRPGTYYATPKGIEYLNITQLQEVMKNKESSRSTKATDQYYMVYFGADTCTFCQDAIYGAGEEDPNDTTGALIHDTSSAIGPFSDFTNSFGITNTDGSITTPIYGVSNNDPSDTGKNFDEMYSYKFDESNNIAEVSQNPIFVGEARLFDGVDNNWDDYVNQETNQDFISTLTWSKSNTDVYSVNINAVDNNGESASFGTPAWLIMNGENIVAWSQGIARETIDESTGETTNTSQVPTQDFWIEFWNTFTK